MRILDGDLVVEQLETRIGFGRSSKYGFRRHCAMRAAEYEGALREMGRRGDPARRGRLLRLLGRPEEARACLDRALAADPARADARAYRWELGLADAILRQRVDFSDIDLAVALEPRNPVWRVWRAIGSLSNAPYSSTHELGAAQLRRLKWVSEAALEDIRAALDLNRRYALAYVAQALAFENLKRWPELVRGLGRAIRLEPREGWLYLFRAVVKTNMGAAEIFGPDDEAAIYLDEGYPFGRFAQGRTEALTPAALVKKADEALRRSSGGKSWWIYVFRAENRRAPPVNDFTGALRDFEKAVALRPGCSWAWAYYAKALVACGKPVEARKAIDRAVALYPRCGWFWIWRGEIQRRAGDARGALRDFDKGLALDPDYELGYAWRGGARRIQGDLKGALRDLDLAVRLDDRHPWTAHERSLVLRAMGRTDEAMRALEDACRLDPKFGWCRDRRAVEESLAELDQELRRRPRSARAYAWRGEAKLSSGDLDGACRDLRRALKLEPRHAWARAWLGRAFALLGRRTPARRELDRAVDMDPHYANAVAWRGKLRQESGDFNGALGDLETAAKLDSRSAWVLEWRAQTKAALGRHAEAARDFRLALDLNGRNGRALLGLSLALRRAGRRRESEENLRQAVAEAARQGESGRAREALALYDEILEADPYFADAQYWKGRLLCGLGRCSEAQSCFDRALALAPRHVWALIASGVCLERLGRPVEGGRRLAQARRLSPKLFAAEGARA